MMDYYNRDGSPVQGATPEEVLLNWAKTYEDDDARRVRSDIVGLLWVSTVFLGMDHSFNGGPPLIFETMVFSRDPDSEASDLFCERYSTEVEALAGHEAVVKSIIDGTFCDYSGEIVDSTYVITEETLI